MFRPRTVRPRMFQTGLFSRVDVSDRLFYKKYFFCSVLFSQKNLKYFNDSETFDHHLSCVIYYDLVSNNHTLEHALTKQFKIFNRKFMNKFYIK